jgi:hypothetical protein
MLGRTIRTKHGMPYKARASGVRSGHSSQTWGRPRTRRRAAGWTEASREACEMHEGHNGETSSRHQAEIHLESHVHGKRACVVWGRADEKGPTHGYLVSCLFHSSGPRRELRLIQEHVAKLQEEIASTVTNCREGQILLSMPPIGPMQATTIITTIGHIPNFEKASALNSSFGWAPKQDQSGISFDYTKQAQGGARPPLRVKGPECTNNS